MLVLLAVVCLLWYIFIWCIHLVGLATARKRYRFRPTNYTPSASIPGVSILRPLKGLDPNLYENLESTYLQEYQNYEILFSVAARDDPALIVVHSLLEKYPNVPTSVIVGDECVGANPKVNNLIRPYRQAKHDILWVLDSNISVAPGALARAVDILTAPPTSSSKHRKIALVHHVPFASVSNSSSLGSRIEESFLNTNHAKMYLGLNAIAVESCVVGKSNLYRRSDLERVDGSLKPHNDLSSHRDERQRGLRAFGKFLAEDNMIASALWHELGFRHDLSCDLAMNMIGNMSLLDYINRRVRWIRVRKYMSLSATLVEPLTESIVLGVLASASFNYLFGFPPYLFLPTHFALWLTTDLNVYASLAGHFPPSGSRMQFLAAWLLRELLACPIWLLAVPGNRVVWRGKSYRILRNGEVSLVGTSERRTRSFFRSLRIWTANDTYEPLEQE